MREASWRKPSRRLPCPIVPHSVGGKLMNYKYGTGWQRPSRVPDLSKAAGAWQGRQWRRQYGRCRATCSACTPPPQIAVYNTIAAAFKATYMYDCKTTEGTCVIGVRQVQLRDQIYRKYRISRCQLLQTSVRWKQNDFCVCKVYAFSVSLLLLLLFFFQNFSVDKYSFIPIYVVIYQ